MKTRIILSVVLAAAGLVGIQSMAAPQFVSGFVMRELFLDIPGQAVSDLTADQKFIDNQPAGVSLLSSVEAPQSSGENYGQRLSGVLLPPATGAYVFFIASRDTAELWLSTDATGANKQMIASVPVPTASREWNRSPDSQNNSASPSSLEAGKPYYFEVLMKAGSSRGDNLAVGWVLPGQYVDPANPPDGLTNITVIAGNSVGALVETNNAKVTITSPPTNVTSFVGSRALFSVKAEGTSDLGSLLLYQWKRNGQDVAGATTASYLTPELTLADSGARYLCVVSVPGAALGSSEATLTVVDSQAPQLHIDPPAAASRDVAVWWDSPDLGFNLESTIKIGGATWTQTSQQPVYAGTTARVTLPIATNSFLG